MKIETGLVAPLLLALAAGTLACGSGAGGPVDPPQAGNTSSGTVTITAPMHAARAAHTATAIPGGRVLIVGGFSGEERSAAGAELYSPGTGQFSTAGRMGTPRHSHTATLLQNGKVLIAGGYDARTATLAGAELYDPATDTFAPTGSLLHARSGHVAELLRDGRVLVAGGLGPGWEFLSSAELYDPATGRFTATGPMTIARESHIAVRLADGRVLVAGGHRGRGAGITLHASAETYDAGTGTFTPAGDMTVRRHKHDAVVLRDGTVLITGGADERDERGVYDSSELFDPATGRFAAGPRMQRPRYKHNGTSLLLPNGTVLLAGGATQAEMYDPRRQAFVLAGGEPRMAGQFSAVAPLGGGRALVTGGYGDGSRPRAAAWLYQP